MRKKKTREILNEEFLLSTYTMGKLNKKPSSNTSTSFEETSVDWSQLIAHFENQSVDHAIESIMKKVRLIYFFFRT